MLGLFRCCGKVFCQPIALVSCAWTTIEAGHRQRGLGLDGDAYHGERLAVPLRSGGKGSVLCGRKLAQQPAGPRHREKFRRHGEDLEEFNGKVKLRGE